MFFFATHKAHGVGCRVNARCKKGGAPDPARRLSFRDAKSQKNQARSTFRVSVFGLSPVSAAFA